MANETILVVDDEKNIVELAHLCLESDGFKVEAAGDGQTALDKVHTLRWTSRGRGSRERGWASPSAARSSRRTRVPSGPKAGRAAAPGSLSTLPARAM